MFLKFLIIIFSPHVKKFMKRDLNSLRWVFNSSTKTFLRRSLTLNHISIRRNARILYKVFIFEQESSYNIFLHRETSSQIKVNLVLPLKFLELSFSILNLKFAPLLFSLLFTLFLILSSCFSNRFLQLSLGIWIFKFKLLILSLFCKFA